MLPEVGSTSVSPGAICPARSAASTMLSAIRSLTEPAGLRDSSLPSTSAQPSGVTRSSRTSGVEPTRSRTESAIVGSARSPTPRSTLTLAPLACSAQSA